MAWYHPLPYVYNQIISGVGENRLDPEGVTSRGQIAKLLVLSPIGLEEAS